MLSFYEIRCWVMKNRLLFTILLFRSHDAAVHSLLLYLFGFKLVSIDKELFFSKFFCFLFCFFFVFFVFVSYFFLVHTLAYHLSEESDKLYYRQQLSRLNSISSIKLPSPDFSSLPTLPPIDIYPAFDEFASRTYKIIPLGLALIKTQTSNVSDRLKFLFDFNWNWLPYMHSYSSHNHITNNIKASLSSDEYQNLLKHINLYIDKVVSDKITAYESEQRQAKIDPKLALYIASIVKEQIIHTYTLTDAEIERIADIVRRKLTETNEWNESKTSSFTLSQENLEDISKIVKQNIEIHAHEWKITNNAAAPITDGGKLDIDEILFKILTSPKLANFVIQRISNKVDPIADQVKVNQKSIDEIIYDLRSLKANIADSINENHNAQIELTLLKADQADLTDRMVNLQNHNNEQFEKILEEIDLKLSALNDKHFSAIDEHIRNVLIEIIGFKSNKPVNNVDITNWIRNVFVARDVLDAELAKLNEKFDKKLSTEINRSASIVIKDISDKIKHDVLIIIEKNNAEMLKRGSATVDVNSLLDEKRIKQIVQQALAVYDADKTGLVDYALESAGGEVLSTR